MPQPIPISKTKIIVPSRRPELLSRPRLLEGLKSLLDNLDSVNLSKDTGYWKFDFEPGQVYIDYFQYLEIIRQENELTKEEITRAYEEETGNVIAETFEALDPAAVPGVAGRCSPWRARR